MVRVKDRPKLREHAFITKPRNNESLSKDWSRSLCLLCTLKVYWQVESYIAMAVSMMLAR